MRAETVSEIGKLSAKKSFSPPRSPRRAAENAKSQGCCLFFFAPFALLLCDLCGQKLFACRLRSRLVSWRFHCEEFLREAARVIVEQLRNALCICRSQLQPGVMMSLNPQVHFRIVECGSVGIILPG